MAAIKTMHEAFLHELGDAYDAERQLTKALPKLIDQARHPMVKQGLEHHLNETNQQVQNLEQVFQALGGSPEKVTCKGMSGIIGENESTLKEIKASELMDGAIVGGGQKVEHYEIATYRCLVAKATLMGHAEAARLLKKNLQMEEEFAQKLAGLEEQLGRELVRDKPHLIGHAIMAGQGGMEARADQTSAH